MLPSSHASTAPRQQSLAVSHSFFTNMTNHHPSPRDLTPRAPAVAKPRRPATLSTGLNIRQQVKLSKEQQEAVALVMAGHNVFLTGSAGTGKSGKSVLLRETIRALKQKHSDQVVAVTASTGIAACNIGGCMLHSFAGFGLGLEMAEDASACDRREYIASRDLCWPSRWSDDVEVSMIEASLFDKIIVAGDFFQLPPVCKTQGVSPVFVFDAKTWGEVIVRGVTLKRVFRQDDALL
ncbi:hypothetical protein AURDEDRAFT_169989 [Auricularia subglabra TFB-10046 SS5]|uniref:ATP-dependent DNA helicase n=1 Tax=Auricularia subglabra (strain TFB-10046 / SS5) TaxID=717982 RepID=J0LK33_AURST|nr:hypothetical protein AURDEDRAFT_169989 [Auricularia subglabra TFB-10046 SS5]